MARSTNDPLSLKGAFLREAEAWQCHTVCQLCDLNFDDGGVRRSNLRGPQYRVLREDFAINLGDEMILAGCVVPPDLSEFDSFYGHGFIP